MHIRKALFVLVGMLILVLPAFSQEEGTIYSEGRFNVLIPDGWTDESTDNYGLFTYEDNLSVYLLAVEADDVETGIDVALTQMHPGFNAEPVVSSEVPAPNGVWTQNVYMLEDEAIGVALAQTPGEFTYVIYFHALDEAALQSSADDINSIVLGFTTGEMVDLSGVVPVPLGDEALADLESYVTEAMVRYQVPGSAIGIVQNGEIVYAGGFGVTDIERSTPVTSDTLFMIGSVTKSMTTMMMGTLVDEATLDWDQPVTDILPAFTLSDPDATPHIRVRDMVNNSSGVPRYDIAMFLEAPTPEELIDSLVDIPVVAEPGMEYHYSNQMVASGGYIATMAAGAQADDLRTSYIRLMQERVFDPIGMADTTLAFDEAIASGDYALPHWLEMQTGAVYQLPLDYERSYVTVAPAAAVWSNVNDMSRYLITQLNVGVSPDGTRVISEGNLLETQEPEVTVDGTVSYGMGWFIDEYKGLRLLQHGGGTQGFTSDLAFLPEADLGVVVLTNRVNAASFTAAVYEYVFELAFELGHEADARYWSAEQYVLTIIASALGSMEIGELDPEIASNYIGLYERGVEVAFDEARAALVLRAAHGAPPLLPVEGEAGTFLFGDGLPGVMVTFEGVNDGGMTMTITSLLRELLGEAQSLTLARIE